MKQYLKVGICAQANNTQFANVYKMLVAMPSTLSLHT